MSKKSVLLVVLILVAAAVAVVAVQRFVVSQGLPEGLIQANGRIEGDHVTIASKFAGRVQELLVREGDTVTARQVLVRLDDSQTQARVEQARRGFEAFEAQVQATHTSLAVLNLEVPLSIEAAEAVVASARAAMDKSESEVARAAHARAMKELAQAELGWKRIRAKEDEVAALERQRDQAEAALAEAQTILEDFTIVAPARSEE